MNLTTNQVVSNLSSLYLQTHPSRHHPNIPKLFRKIDISVAHKVKELEGVGDNYILQYRISER